MGLFSKQDATPNTDKYVNEVKEFLVQGEEIENIYPQLIDYLCITNKRIIFADKVISIKDPTTTTHSIPFKNIVSIGYEKSVKLTAFTDEISVTTIATTYKLKFPKVTMDIKSIYKQLVNKIL